MSVELNAKVLEWTEIAPGLVILRVAPDGWELPDFEAGQFAVLGLPQKAPRCETATLEHDADTSNPDKLIKRAYSIASSSREKEYLELLIALVPSGGLTSRLFALRPGDRLWLGPKISGSFTLEAVPPEQQLVLIGTGTGVTPYVSMLRSRSRCAERRIALLHGARHSWELGYRNELDRLAHECPTFDYIPIISRPEEEHIPWAGETGHVQDVWKRKPLDAIWAAHPTAANCHVFLCGNPGMIENMLTILIEEGFTEHSTKTPGQVHLERYW